MNEKIIKKIARIALGNSPIFAGISHLTFAGKEFRAQAPNWAPIKKDDTVVCSGIAEITLGYVLMMTDKRHMETIGKLASLFFLTAFPTNISQYVNRRNGF